MFHNQFYLYFHPNKEYLALNLKGNYPGKREISGSFHIGSNVRRPLYLVPCALLYL